MCHWLGPHFHDWIDSNGVAFSIELLEWVAHFRTFCGKTVLIYGSQTYQNICSVDEK